MESRDLDLRLCAKDPIFVDGVPIYPISIKEISRIGYTKYNTDIRFLSLNESDIGALLGRDISGVGSFNYLVGNAIHDKETMQMMLFWFSKITHSNVSFSGKRLSFVGDGFEITKDNFDEIQSIPDNCIGMFNSALNMFEHLADVKVVLCSATPPLLEKIKHPLQWSQYKDIDTNYSKDMKKIHRVFVTDKTDVQNCFS